MHDDPTPIEPDELDELLSAELDGELDTVARERGISAVELSARLRATPDADGRRAALAAARDLLGQTPEIDELLAARLRAKAVRAAQADGADVRAARSRRRYRLLGAAAGIAAASLGVVALAGGLSGQHGASKSAGSRAADAPARVVAPSSSAASSPQLAYGSAGVSQPAALGTFTDKRALALAAVGRASAVDVPAVGQSASQGAGNKSGSFSTGSKSAPPANTARTPGPTTFKGLSANAPTSAQKRSESNSIAAADSSAAVACTARPAGVGGDAEVLRATAVLSGKPVVVLVFASDREHIVVIEDTHCALLDVQMLG